MSIEGVQFAWWDCQRRALAAEADLRELREAAAQLLNGATEAPHRHPHAAWVRQYDIDRLAALLDKEEK